MLQWARRASAVVGAVLVSLFVFAQGAMAQSVSTVLVDASEEIRDQFLAVASSVIPVAVTIVVFFFAWRFVRKLMTRAG